MRRIVAATDLSSRSEVALRRAAIVARGAGAALEIVHAVDDDQPAAVIEAHRREAARLLAEAAAKLADAAGAPCATRVVAGDPAESLAAAAAGAAAIVIGPHRRRLVRDFFVGTTGDRIVRAATAPVLSVHGPPAGPYRRVLLALDGSPASAAAVAAVRALDLAPAGDAVAFCAVDAPVLAALSRGGGAGDGVAAARATARREGLAAIDAALAGAGVACRRAVEVAPDGAVADAIGAAAARFGCDLIAMGARGRGAVEGLFLGSVAEATLARAAVDVLVAPLASPA